MTDLRDSILFFDSGVGGLTVLSECVKKLQGVRFAYFGDNENAPYGNLSPTQIEARVFSVFESFAPFPPRAIVLACNTVTAVCAEKLRKKYSFPVIGAEPAVFPALRALQEREEAFVFTTRATFESLRFHNLCARAQRAYAHAQLRSFPCDALAGEIERQIFNLQNFNLAPFLPQGNPDAVVLGCTHYSFLKPQISAYYNCPIYDSATGICRRIESLLGLVTTENHTPFSPSVLFLGNAKSHNQKVFEHLFG